MGSYLHNLVAQRLDPSYLAIGHRYTLALCSSGRVSPTTPEFAPYRYHRGGRGRGYDSSSCPLEGIALLWGAQL